MASRAPGGTDAAIEEPIVVVGAGIVGATLALALAAQGQPVRLIERQPPALHSGRLGYELRSVAISQGCAQWMLELVARSGSNSPQPHWQPFRRMVVEEASNGARVNLDASECGSDALGYIGEHSAVAQWLWQAVQQAPLIECICPAQLRKVHWPDALASGRSEPVEVLVDDGTTQTIATPLLIGCDGGRSFVAEQAGVQYWQVDAHQRAVVSIIRARGAPADVAWQRFTEAGPVALLPLLRKTDDVNTYSVVWSVTPERATWLEACDDGQFTQALSDAVGYWVDAIEAVDQRASFPLLHKHSSTYLPRTGTVLLGDSAHVVHPLAGQGANLGLRDARALVAILSEGRKLGLAPSDDRLLRRFERARMADNLTMQGAIGVMRALWAEGDPLLDRGRHQALRWISNDAALRRTLIAQACV